MAKKQFERREEMPGQNPGKTQDPNRRNPETGSRRSDTDTGQQKISNDNLEQEGNTDDMNRRSSEEPVEDNSTRS